ncbi:MAG: putative ATP-dependent DNA helicase [Prokaryotic dsDNA virus sp.]|nr:MAG: putative ATP-dependent DNA helicase [Prokaryotic dsDNA virus sp.]|tara:strand:- start:35078 stop:36409 length:1332 start_codon:yes stop_codon:yes gene_type:complete
MQLNEKQQKAVELFLDFILNPEAYEFILAGYSGCGKTTVVRELINQALAAIEFDSKLHSGNNDVLDSSVHTIYLTATTNQAAENIQSITDFDATTYHSLLGLKLFENYKTGETSLRETRDTIPLSNCIIFIDEASYITASALALIRKLVKQSDNCKIVYVGDSAQLLGDSSGTSPVFDIDSEYKIELTEVMRTTGDNPIIDIATEYRKAIKEGIKSLPYIEPDNKHVFALDGEEFSQKVIDHFKQNPSTNARVLVYHNATAIQHNLNIREALGFPADRFVLDEPLVSNGVVKNKQNSIVIRNNQKVIVTGVSNQVETYTPPHPEMSHLSVNYRVYTVQPDGHKGLSSVNVKIPVDINTYLKLQKAFASNMMWSDYFRLKSFFADLRPTYSSTIHKIQGMTLDTVFIDMSDIEDSQHITYDTALRLIYVGLTRTADKAYLYYDT